MKAQKVHENIGFQRDKDITKTLNIGEDRSWEEGDLIELKEDVFWIDDTYANNGGNWKTELQLSQIGKTHDTDNVVGLWNEGDMMKYDSYDDEFKLNTHEWINRNWIDENPHVWKRVSTNESMDFKRSKDITKSLNIGIHRVLKDTESIIFHKDLLHKEHWIIAADHPEDRVEIPKGLYNITRETNSQGRFKIDGTPFGFYEDWFYQNQDLWDFSTNESMDFKRTDDIHKSLQIGEDIDILNRFYNLVQTSDKVESHTSIETDILHDDIKWFAYHVDGVEWLVESDPKLPHMIIANSGGKDFRITKMSQLRKITGI